MNESKTVAEAVILMDRTGPPQTKNVSLGFTLIFQAADHSIKSH